MFAEFWGDSTVVGQVGPSAGKSFASLLASKFGLPVRMNAANGSCSADQAIVAQSLSFAPTSISVILEGVNDTQRYFTPAQHAYFKGFYAELLSRLSYLSRVSCRDAGMVKTGAWANTQPGWSEGCSSNTAGSTASAVLKGRTFLVGTTLQDYFGSPVPGVAEVRVDGDLVGAYSSNGQGMPTAHNTFAPAAFRFPGKEEGEYTVEVKVISGFIYLEYLLGSEQPQGEKIFALTPTRTYQPSDNGAMSTALGIIVKQLVLDFQADGRDVHLVDVAAKQTPAHVTADLIHLNDAFNKIIADDVFAAYMSALPPPVFTETICYESEGKGYMGIGGRMVQVYP